MVFGVEAQGLYSLKFHYCQNSPAKEALPYSFTVSPACVHTCTDTCTACYNFRSPSAGGGDGEEPRRVPLGYRDPAVAPLHGHGGGFLHGGHDLGLHAHEAQVQQCIMGDALSDFLSAPR